MSETSKLSCKPFPFGKNIERRKSWASRYNVCESPIMRVTFETIRRFMG